jgi:hypothetical protein
MRIERAIDDVREAETALAERLRVVGERHAAEHDLFHLGHTLAQQCAAHLGALQPFAERYGAASTAGAAGAATSPGVMETLRRKASELLGHSESTGLLLLTDLRENYLTAQRAEIGWIILLQAARATRDAELIDAATSCHEQTEGVARWLRTKIKAAAPQILVAG